METLFTSQASKCEHVYFVHYFTNIFHGGLPGNALLMKKEHNSFAHCGKPRCLGILEIVFQGNGVLQLHSHLAQ